MANVFKLKQSSVAGKTPATGQMTLGEIAVNTTDGKLFTKKSVSGTETVESFSPDSVTAANLASGLAGKAPLTGTGASGTWPIAISGNAATATTAGSTTGNAATATKLATARAINGVNFDGSAPITIYDATKAPLTGTGTSGTWPISITGKSGSFTVIDDRNVVSQPNQVPDRSGVFNFRFKENVGSPPFPASATYAHVLTINGWTADGTGGWPTQMSFGERLSYRKGATSTTWGVWKQLVDSTSIGEFAPSLTGTGASGTWGISITGNAATATNVAWSGVTGKPAVIAAGADAATARAAIGAGTSNLAVGTTAVTAKAGNWVPTVAEVTGLTAALDGKIANGAAAPIAHVGSGGTAHAAATTSVAGFLSAADKTKLDSLSTLPNKYLVSEISTSTTAVAGTCYVISANLTLTLIAAPAVGDEVAFADISGLTTVIIGNNGKKIMNLAEAMTLDVPYAKGILVYTGTNFGWVRV